MTTPHARLVEHLADFIVTTDQTTPPDGPNPDTARRALIRFADAYNLDLQDTATLFRVASGEAIDPRRSVPAPDLTLAGAGIRGTFMDAPMPDMVYVRRRQPLNGSDRTKALNLLRGVAGTSAIMTLEDAGYTIVPPAP